jgi:hypothetical protein
LGSRASYRPRRGWNLAVVGRWKEDRGARSGRTRLAPTARRGQLDSSFPGSALAKAERAWGTLRKAVVLPRVRRSLYLRHVLPRCRVEVVQPAGCAGRVRVIQSPRHIGVVRSARRTLHLTSESGTCTCTRNGYGAHRSREQRLRAHLSSPFDMILPGVSKLLKGRGMRQVQ